MVYATWLSSCLGMEGYSGTTSISGSTAKETALILNFSQCAPLGKVIEIGRWSSIRVATCCTSAFMTKRGTGSGLCVFFPARDSYKMRPAVVAGALSMGETRAERGAGFDKEYSVNPLVG